METKGKGFVLHTIKHTDKSLICRIFTLEWGARSFVYPLNKQSRREGLNLLQPLNRLKFSTQIRDNQHLSPLRQPALEVNYSAIPFDPVKSSVALFLNELLHRTLPDDYRNPGLFRFLETAMDLLDQEVVIRNFPIWFVRELSREFGFDPSEAMPDEKIAGRLFAWNERSAPDGMNLRETWSTDWMRCSYPEFRELTMQADVRRLLLSDMVGFLLGHLGLKREIHSLEIMHDVLRA